MRLRKKSVITSFTNLFDDNDEEIYLGQKLNHELGWIVEVVQLTHGEITGKVLNFCKPEMGFIYYSLNNGKGYTIIKNEDEKNN